MAGRTWRDLKRDVSKSSNTQRSSDKSFNHLSGSTANDRQDSAANKNTAQSTIEQSPRLSKLMEERKSLEDKMSFLSVGGDQLNPRDSARFSVPSFAERRAEQQEWDRRRDSAVSRGSSLTNTASQGVQGESSRDDLSQWLNNRDQQRNSIRESSRDRLSSVNNARNSVSRGIDSLSNMSRQLDQIDQMSVDQGFGDNTNMRDLNAANVDDLGGARLNDLSLNDRGGTSANSQNSDRNGNSELSDVRKKIKKPLDEIKKIEKSWEEKRDKISGAMDKIGPYVENITRRLSVDNGGSGNIFERMKRNKEKALARRKEANEQEKKDEKRRERASENRRKKDKENE